MAGQDKKRPPHRGEDAAADGRNDVLPESEQELSRKIPAIAADALFPLLRPTVFALEFLAEKIRAPFAAAFVIRGLGGNVSYDHANGLSIDFDLQRPVTGLILRDPETTQRMVELIRASVPRGDHSVAFILADEIAAARLRHPDEERRLQ